MDKTTVIIVVDKSYGDSLKTIADQSPVWIVDSDVNQKAARAIWEERGDAANVTIFKSVGELPEEIFTDIIASVDLHHGPFSQRRPYNSVICIGASLSNNMQRALKEHGLNAAIPHALGWIAFLKNAG